MDKYSTWGLKNTVNSWLLRYKMTSHVKFVVFAHGNIVNGANGPEYDRDPVKLMKVRTSATHAELLRTICRAVGIDPTVNQVEIYHRLPMLVAAQVLSYRLIAIQDDDDVESMIELAIEHGGRPIHELFVRAWATPAYVEMNRCNNPIMETQTHSATLHHQQYQNTEAGMSSRGNSGGHRNISAVQHEANAHFQYDVEARADMECGLNDGNDSVDENNSLSDEDFSEYEEGDEHTDDTDSEEGSGTGGEAYALGGMQTPMGGAAYPDESGPSSVNVRDSIPFFNVGGGDGTIHFEAALDATMSSQNSGKELAKGMMFSTKEDLVREVRRFHYMNHCDYIVKESRPNFWSVHCRQKVDQGCKWRLRACKKKVEGLFVITKVEGPHTCVNALVDQDHRRVDVKALAKVFVEYVRENPEKKIGDLQQVARDHFGYMVSRRKAWVARKVAIAHVYGDWDKSYEELPTILTAIKTTNLGTKVKWGWTATGEENVSQFKWVFWTFGPCVQAFSVCRPILTVDGTHLYGKYKHHLLVACSADGDNKIVPVAFAIVPGETAESWSWFLRKIKTEVVGERGGETICLISDRGSGIISAVTDPSNGWQPPFAVHRFCSRHVTSNFSKEHKSMRLRRLIQYAAMQAQPRKFEILMGRVHELSPEALQWFNKVDRNGELVLKKEQWALAYDGFYRFGCTTSNMAETYNSVILGSRGLPLKSLVRKIFYNCVMY